MNLRYRELKNQKTHRLINSRFPTVSVFDRYADSEEELRVAFELEEATNPRLISRLHALPEGSMLLAGPDQGVAFGNAAFIHCAEEGGRFNDGRLGAWYASFEIDTAIAETVYHNERRLRSSEGGFPNRMQVRELIATMSLSAVDICRAKGRGGFPELYKLDNYSESQAFANSIRWPYAEPGEDVIVYDSVREDGGTNVCVFRPQVIDLPILQGAHYQYEWDGLGILAISELREYRV